MPSSDDNVCVDCAASGTPTPKQRTPRSPRCPAHQQDWRNHLTQRRNRLARRRRNPSLPKVPSAKAWAQDYRPRPLPGDDARPGAVTIAADTAEKVRDTTDRLASAATAARAALRGKDPAAARKALTGLATASERSVATLRRIPGLTTPPAGAPDSEARR